jgi:hypothetical protein
MPATFGRVKLHEALTDRAATKKHLEQLRHRVINASRHQEGEDPAESAADLLAEYERLAVAQARLITAINLTNTTVHVNVDGHVISLTEALALRDERRSRHKLFTDVADTAAGTSRHGFGGYRMTRGEIRDVAGIDVVTVRRAADDLSADLRRLESVVQRAGLDADLTEL